MEPTISIVRSVAVHRRDSVPVAVRASAGPGEPGLRLVGLPEAVAAAATKRVIASLLESALPVPAGELANVAITVDPPGQGEHPELDLAIAIAVLAACGHLRGVATEDIAALGELRGGSLVRTFMLEPALEVLDAATILLPAGHLDVRSPHGASVRRVSDLRQAVELLRADAEPVPGRDQAGPPASDATTEFVLVGPPGPLEEAPPQGSRGPIWRPRLRRRRAG